MCDLKAPAGFFRVARLSDGGTIWEVIRDCLNLGEAKRVAQTYSCGRCVTAIAIIINDAGDCVGNGMGDLPIGAEVALLEGDRDKDTGILRGVESEEVEVELYCGEWIVVPRESAVAIGASYV